MARAPAWLLLGLVLLGTTLLYWPVLDAEFPFDDQAAAKAVKNDGSDNPAIATLQPLSHYFSTEYWIGTGKDELDSNPLYRPLTVWSFAWLRDRFYREGPGDQVLHEARPQHVANLLLYLGTVVLMYLLVRRLGLGRVAALLGATLYAVHAIHSEVVAMIVGRAELMSMLFGLAACNLYLVLVGTRSRPGVFVASLFGCACALFLAFCSKESALAWLPFLPVLGVARRFLDHHPDPWVPLLARQAMLTLAVGILPVAAWWYLRHGAFYGLGGDWQVAYVTNPLYHLSTGERWLTAVSIWAWSLWRTLLPVSLCCDYSANVFGLVDQPFDPGFLVAFLVLAAVLVLGLRYVRRAPLGFAAMASFLGMTFATSNVPFAIGTVFAERLVFLASIAVPLGALALWQALRARPTGRAVMLGAVAVWVLVNGLVTSERASVWKNDVVLFANDVQVHPRSLMLRLQAAVQDLRQGNMERWRSHLEAALEVEPEFARAHIELAGGSMKELSSAMPRARQVEILEAAIEHLQKAERCRILEGYERIMLYHNLAVARCAMHQPAAAIEAWDKLFAEFPTNHRQRSDALLAGLGELADDDFMRLLKDGERLAPERLEWKWHRGRRALLLNRPREAVENLRESLQPIKAGGIDSPALKDYVSWARAENLLGNQANVQAIQQYLQLNQQRFR
ncbi:MAG: DUF1736 domain-containing protein [Planctomycetota bacterium]